MMMQQASLGLKIVHTIITAWKWSTEAERSSYNTKIMVFVNTGLLAATVSTLGTYHCTQTTFY